MNPPNIGSRILSGVGRLLMLPVQCGKWLVEHVMHRDQAHGAVRRSQPHDQPSVTRGLNQRETTSTRRRGEAEPTWIDSGIGAISGESCWKLEPGDQREFKFRQMIGYIKECIDSRDKTGTGNTKWQRFFEGRCEIFKKLLEGEMKSPGVDVKKMKDFAEQYNVMVLRADKYFKADLLFTNQMHMTQSVESAVKACIHAGYDLGGLGMVLVESGNEYFFGKDFLPRLSADLKDYDIGKIGAALVGVKSFDHIELVGNSNLTERQKGLLLASYAKAVSYSDAVNDSQLVGIFKAVADKQMTVDADTVKRLLSKIRYCDDPYALIGIMEGSEGGSSLNFQDINKLAWTVANVLVKDSNGSIRIRQGYLAPGDEVRFYQAVKQFQRCAEGVSSQRTRSSEYKNSQIPEAIRLSEGYIG